MKSKMFKDTLVIGLALFCMFFGAGNLIFPPFLGKMVGDQFVFAAIGFLITGVGFPFLAILACAKINGSFDKMGERVGNLFAVASMIVLTSLIGPVAAVPRTAATTFELGVSTLLPGASHPLTVIVYFLIVLYFVLKPTSIVDLVGKVLTPVLLVILTGIIVIGIVNPIGELVPVGANHAFSQAFREGYNTMDALGATIMAAIPLAAVKAKGYTDEKSASKVLILAGLISSVGLGFVYSGLMFLGAQMSPLMLEIESFSRIELLVYIAYATFGPLGTILLSLLTILACLSTAIVLLIMSTNFFTKLLKGKFSYGQVAVFLTIISTLISMLDVDQIVELVNPLLDVIYPVVIVLVVITLLGNLIKEDLILRVTVYVTLGFSLITSLNEWLQIEVLNQVLVLLPFHDIGFDWVAPAMGTFLMMVAVVKGVKCLKRKD